MLLAITSKRLMIDRARITLSPMKRMGERGLATFAAALASCWRWRGRRAEVDESLGLLLLLLLPVLLLEVLLRKRSLLSMKMSLRSTIVEESKGECRGDDEGRESEERGRPALEGRR